MKTTNKIEKRSFTTELRASSEENPRQVTGYAAVYNSRSEDLGGFTEVIAPGAFDGVVERSDVRALFNHDPNKILARSKYGAGTLELFVDTNGLGYRFTAPNTTAGNDLLESLKRGDIDQSSFGFTVEADKWDEDKENRKWLRTIEKVSALFDVSPVTYPAYVDTSAAQRSLDKIKQQQQENKEAPAPRADNSNKEKELYLLRAKANL